MSPGYATKFESSSQKSKPCENEMNPNRTGAVSSVQKNCFLQEGNRSWFENGRATVNMPGKELVI